MNIIIICLVVSIIISVFVSNVVGCYYLKNNDDKWSKVYDEIIKYIDSTKD